MFLSTIFSAHSRLSIHICQINKASTVITRGIGLILSPQCFVDNSGLNLTPMEVVQTPNVWKTQAGMEKWLFKRGIEEGNKFRP